MEGGRESGGIIQLGGTQKGPWNADGCLLQRSGLTYKSNECAYETLILGAVCAVCVRAFYYTYGYKNGAHNSQCALIFWLTGKKL